MNRHKIRYHAYLVMGMRHNGTPYPSMVSVGIYSSNSQGLTYNPGLGDFYADVMSMEGDSYQQAKDRLEEIIKKLPSMKWVIPWINDSMDAHMARFHWQILPAQKD